MPSCDVLVIGLGTAGSATCMTLAERGISVLGLSGLDYLDVHGMIKHSIVAIAKNIPGCVIGLPLAMDVGCPG